MFIIKHKKIFITISAVLVLLSLISLFTFGLKIGIDFKGGALTEVTYTTLRPAQADVETALAPLELGSVLVQPTGDLGYIIKSRDLNQEEHETLLESLTLGGQNELTETNFNSIGPSVGRELTKKAIIAVILVSLTIICFIAIITLLHDVLIPVGLFVVLSHFYGAEVDTLFVVAVLTILGLSVSDTIVIFDRIRENLKEIGNKPFVFSEVVGRSLEQSFVRSLCTSLTVILVLLALFLFGPVSTKYFAMMLTTGMFFGTYSSLFLASPLLVLTEEWQNKKS